MSYSVNILYHIVRSKLLSTFSSVFGDQGSKERVRNSKHSIMFSVPYGHTFCFLLVVLVSTLASHVAQIQDLFIKKTTSFR